MRNCRQFSFWSAPEKSYGGEKKGAKIARPIATKRAMHLVLRSRRAKGEWSMMHYDHQCAIVEVLQRAAKRHRVRVHRFANVGNHLHAVIQAARRQDIQNFLRAFAGAVALAVTKSKKGAASGKFWDDLAFTRIIDWGRDWKNMLVYLDKNLWEGLGLPRAWYHNWFGPPSLSHKAGLS